MLTILKKEPPPEYSSPFTRRVIILGEKRDEEYQLVVEIPDEQIEPSRMINPEVISGAQQSL